MKNSVLLSKNPIYISTQFTMQEYQNAYLGGLIFKKTVRQKRPNEDEKLYNDVINNTTIMPVSRYVVDTINDTVFSQPVIRELRFANPNGTEISEESTEWTDLIIYDADLSNRDMNSVMENIGELTSIFGHCYVFVDMPSVDQGNAGRPYVVAISPLDVWNWNYVSVNGRMILGYVKVKEYEDEYCYRFKCYHLGTTTKPSYWESYKVDKTIDLNAEATLIDTGTFPPGMSIPCVVAYTRRDPRLLDIGISDIDTSSDTQREIYKLECEAYQSIQFARTLIRADAGVKVPAHAGGIVRAAEGQIETLTVDTQDVATIISKQESLLINLENLLGFGGLRQNRETVQSGVSMIEERRQLHKVAKGKARQLEICEENIWTFIARFMGVRWAGQIKYGTDYESADTKYQIALMETAQKLSGDNPIIKQLIDYKMLELLADDDELEMFKDRMRILNGEEETVEESNEIVTRDVGDQTPTVLPENQTKEGEYEQNAFSGITYVGQTTPNPAATMLMNLSTGR
jgi:hypothetical protein